MILEIKTADTIPDNLLHEFEHVINLIRSVWTLCAIFNLQKNIKILQDQVKLFPWVIGSIPRTSDYPESPHIESGIPIRSTLTEVFLFLYFIRLPIIHSYIFFRF